MDRGIDEVRLCGKRALEAGFRFAQPRELAELHAQRVVEARLMGCKGNRSGEGGECFVGSLEIAESGAQRVVNICIARCQGCRSSEVRSRFLESTHPEIREAGASFVAQFFGV